MKVIIAIDSFKGSLSSTEVNDACEKGIRQVYERAQIIKVPIADGGEGTVKCLIEGLGGEYVQKDVHDALMRPIKATYGILNDHTAVIEMAACAGLTLLKKNELNPLKTTTYGVGELISDAIEKGCKNFIIGIGGSATNDGGMGMLEALGFRFYDKNNDKLQGIGENLNYITHIDDSKKLKALNDCQFSVLCDVNNPFYGSNGAAHVYAKQKGADSEMIERLDQGLKHFASIVYDKLGMDLQKVKGAGASGGLGGGIYAFLNGELLSGIDMIIKKMGLEERIKDADIIITGEGKIDFQSVMGKVPYGICQLGKKYDIPVIGISGNVDDDAFKLHDEGMTALFSIMNYPMTLDEAMNKHTTRKLIEHNILEIFRLIKAYRKSN